MSKVWHASIDGEQYGPLSPAELKTLAASGKLKPNDHVWKEGFAEWVPASKVKGLFPPSPPSPPPPPVPMTIAASPTPDVRSTPFIMAEPTLGDVVLPDDDATEAWKNRESPMAGHVGWFGSFFQKTIRDFVFTHRQRVFKQFEDGRQILRDDVLARLASAYSSRGFKVATFSSSLIVTKRSSTSSTTVDTSPNPLANVFSLSNAFVRVSEGSDSWTVDIKAEAFFWPRVMEQIMGMVGIAFLALIFFWPCLCLVPFAMAIDADKVRAALQDDIKTPVEKLTIEFV